MEVNEKEAYVELAYARVSTKAQSLERQEASLLEAIPDLKAKYFYKDVYTGKKFDRPEYGKLKEKILELKEANPSTKLRVTLHELDRIGRDYQEIQSEVQWFRSHDVELRFLDIPQELMQDTMGITGDLILDLIILLKAYWAEQELNYKEKRAKEGIAQAKARGVHFGRKEIQVEEVQFRKEADRAIARYITHKEAMRNLGLKDFVYWKWMKHFYPDYIPNKQKVQKQ